MVGTTDALECGKTNIIRETESVCPVCLRKIPAFLVRDGEDVFMEKTCPEHGKVRTVVWRGRPDYESWKNEKIPAVPVNPASGAEKGCPYDCGLCPEHRQHTCCVLMEVTDRCNLRCPVCFAEAGEVHKKEPSLETIGEWYDEMLACGGPFNIQLSGGEPTMRDDLDEIIRLGKKKGFTFFQLNTNGLRLAEEEEYAAHLKAAGLNCVFLQFDGICDETYEKLRGRKLFAVKEKAIENCKKAGLGVVLVPVIAKGVNDGEVGAILDYAVAHMPAIRGVHFQPMSFFGRYEEGAEQNRFTLPELLQAIEEQTDGRMKIEDFKPAGAENAYCSFSGNFMKLEDGSLRPWHDTKSCGCGTSRENETVDAGEAAKRAQEFVAKRWSATEENCCCCEAEEETSECCCGAEEETSCCCCEAEIEEESCCCGMDTSSLDKFLERLDTYSLAVSSMAFMDAWNLDLDRLRDCYIHVISQKAKMNLVPFCAYNLTSVDGVSLYRGREDED